ncbi:MAG: nucleoside-triphosphatase [bacterium]
MKIFITGEIGVGKSTVANMIVELLGKSIAGFATVRVENGFDIVDLKDSVRAPIARKNEKGEFTVFLDGFEKLGVEALEKAANEDDCVVLMDEIGRFEIKAGNFTRKVIELILSNKPVVAVIKYEENPFLELVRRISAFHLFKVTRENRDRLPYDIVEFVRKDWLQL